MVADYIMLDELRPVWRHSECERDFVQSTHNFNDERMLTPSPRREGLANVRAFGIGN
jgi:hypothetical protein